MHACAYTGRVYFIVMYTPSSGFQLKVKFLASGRNFRGESWGGGDLLVVCSSI